MSDAPPNLVLDLLPAVRGDLGEIEADRAEIKLRVGLLEG